MGTVSAVIGVEPLEPGIGRGQHYWERLNTFAGLLGPGTLFKRLGIVDAKRFEQQVTATRLRSYVDEWIETGLVEGEGELPSQRSLLKAPRLTALMREYRKG